MLFFLNSFTLLSRLSLSNAVSNIACKIDEEELHSVFVPMHISAIHQMKKDLVMSAKRGLCRYKSFSCLTLYFFRLFSASAIWCSHKVNLDGRTDGWTDGHLRNLLYYLTYWYHFFVNYVEKIWCVCPSVCPDSISCCTKSQMQNCTTQDLAFFRNRGSIWEYLSIVVLFANHYDG